jgi:ABC-type phosphate/phosphonate transport system ATPase subunit
MTGFTNEQKRAEALRELEMRKRVYGRRGTLTATDEKRIAIMQAIADDYGRAVERDRLL